MCKTKKPCQNGARCIDMENDYKCECTEGFTGANCEEGELHPHRLHTG